MKLNQIIAIEKGVKARCHQELTQAHHGLQKPELLIGLVRNYTPKDAEGDRFPNEEKRVQVHAEEMIRRTAELLTELFDVTATKDVTNCSARADVVVNGQKLIEQAPVSYLLFLEKQLVDIHTFVKKLPVLDPNYVWSYDQARGCMVTSPSESFKTKKVLKNHVKAVATDRHPEQVEVFTEDVVIGTWTTTLLSGALPADRVRQLLDRVEELQKAVKLAREEANMTAATKQEVGGAIFSYLFGK